MCCLSWLGPDLDVLAERLREEPGLGPAEAVLARLDAVEGRGGGADGGRVVGDDTDAVLPPAQPGAGADERGLERVKAGADAGNGPSGDVGDVSDAHVAGRS